MPKMDWKDACKKLQKEGLKFEYLTTVNIWSNPICSFQSTSDRYRIAAQLIPDRADWRELCGKLQDCGIVFEMHHADLDTWSKWKNGFCFSERPIKDFRIPAQPIPAGIRKYLEKEMAEQKQDKPEIPHLEQQIQWHEDKLHSLRTGEPMREWEYRLVVGDGEWRICNDPHFSKRYEYRRKPRTVKYWHCLVEGYGTDGVVYLIESTADALRNHVKSLGYKMIGQVTETTVELED